MYKQKLQRDGFEGSLKCKLLAADCVCGGVPADTQRQDDAEAGGFGGWLGGGYPRGWNSTPGGHEPPSLYALQTPQRSF